MGVCNDICITLILLGESVLEYRHPDNKSP